MSGANGILDEPLTLGQETIPRSAWRSGKVVVPISLIIGFVSAVLLTRSGEGQDMVFQEPGITMFGASASHMSTSCPRLAPVSVPALEASLLKHGIRPSPMAKFALTQFAATRDPSMKAQAREAYSSLDPETKTKLQKLSKDIVVRAETLADTLKKEEMAGAIAPLGFWDPAGFSEKFSAPGPGLYGLRGVELKHGRVCMLASLGFMFGEKFHPLVSDDAGFVSAVATHFTPAMEDTFWPAFVLLCGSVDLVSSVTEDPNTLPGDFGFDPLGLRPTKPAEFLELQNKELSNGRLAMLASAGMIAQELVTGKRIFR